MENPKSLETAGYRCSSSLLLHDTPQFPLASGLRKRIGGNLQFVRCHNSMRSTMMAAGRWRAWLKWLPFRARPAKEARGR